MTTEGDSPLVESEHAVDEAILSVGSESEVDQLGDDDGESTGVVSSWAWLLVGLLAGVIALFTTKVVLSEFQAPMPAEFDQLSESSADGEVPPEADAFILANKEQNQGRLLYALGASMAIVFGWASGVLSGRIPMGIAGALAGVVLAVLLGMFLSPAIMEFEKTVLKSRQSGDLYAMALHGSQWFIVALPIAVAVGVGTKRLGSGLKTVGAVIGAALLGGIIYVMGGTLLDPSARLAYAQPVAGTLSYIWHLVPPLLCGLFMSRSKLL